MRLPRKFVFGLLSLFIFSRNLFAIECDKRGMEQLLAQITTLRNELREVIPIGTILPYSGKGGLPQGFRSCNGDSFDRVQMRRLFDAVGLTFTPENEHAGTTFRIPNLERKVLIGTEPNPENLNGKIELGKELGSESQILREGNLPPHKHKGETGDNNRDHTHKGETGGELNDHHHNFPHRTEQTIYNRWLQPANCNFLLIGHEELSTTTSGAAGQHKHAFETWGQSQSHKHLFATDNGLGTSEEFSVIQPSVGMHFMIKVE